MRTDFKIRPRHPGLEVRRPVLLYGLLLGDIARVHPSLGLKQKGLLFKDSSILSSSTGESCDH
jgi:hypothetical protein